MDDLEYANRDNQARHRGEYRGEYRGRPERSGNVWQRMAAWEAPGDTGAGWPQAPASWDAPPADFDPGYDAGYQYAGSAPPPSYPPHPAYPPYSPQAYGTGMAGLDMLRLDEFGSAPGPGPGPGRGPGPDPGRRAAGPDEGDGRGARRRPPGPPPRRRPPGATSLIADYPGEADPAPRGTEPLDAGDSPAPSAFYGRTLPPWLPFGRRLVLLPKGGSAVALGENPARRDVGDGLRPAVFGAMDGLVTNASLIAGIGGGGGGHDAIVATGIAGLIAGALSMATGEYISVKSQNELTKAEVDRERLQHARDRKGRLDKLARAFVGKGVSPNLAQAVATQISADPERAVAEHVREDLGLNADDLPSPVTAAVASLVSFTFGAQVPLAPFLLGFPVLWAALVLAGLCAFGGGAAVARLTGRPMALGGMRQFAAAFVATDMAFVLGRLIGGHV